MDSIKSFEINTRSKFIIKDIKKSSYKDLNDLYTFTLLLRDGNRTIKLADMDFRAKNKEELKSKINNIVRQGVKDGIISRLKGWNL